MSKKVILLGGRGDPITIAKAMIDANRRGNTEWEVVGLLNDTLVPDTILDGFKVIGGLNRISEFLDEDYYFLNGIYRIDGNQRRIKMFKSHDIPDSRLVHFIHPTAYVAPGVSFGPGCIIMPNVGISQEVRFGKCCIVLQGTTIGHNNHIADFVHISAQVCLGGYVTIEKGVHVGMNATVRETVHIGSFSTLGMGSVLLKSIGPGEIWAGNPAKFLRRPREDE